MLKAAPSIQVIEVPGEGLVGLIGQRVTLYCGNFIYTGKLIGVNTSDVLLEDAEIVYDTGSHDTKDWSVAQRLPNNWYVRTTWIESYGIFK